LNYEVQLKPFAADFLFIAGRPEFLRVDSPLLIRTASDTFRLGVRTTETLRYGVYSYLEEAAGEAPVNVPSLAPERRRVYLSLPAVGAGLSDLTARPPQAAQPIWRSAGNRNFLKRNYAYSLELRDVSGRPLAYFLFDRKAGHCEYFASSMAVMLRLAGIPSRVVTGFQGSIYNPISGWHIVRAADAHSWVEAHLGGLGWTTFDPTPPGLLSAAAGALVPPRPFP
jgi:transglutaminase-like putative cysteine protease